LFVRDQIDPSSIVNSTFRNIQSLYSSCRGGVIWIFPVSQPSVTIDRCVFGNCTAYYGGAVGLSNSIYYVNLTRTRFEGNSATYGADIICVETCLNDYSSGTLASTTCSTSSGTRVAYYYDGSSSSQISSNCSSVLLLFFFFFFFFILYFEPFFFLTNLVFRGYIWHRDH
jgi:hypothetical protein